MRIPGLLAIVCLGSGCASAEAAPTPWNRAVLVELFTSQGCSACPAAEALVRDLPALGLGRDKVVPLAFHVNYWDELGWKDPFARQAFTARQERYSHAAGLRSPDGNSRPAGLYTPQMIIDGQVHFSGASRKLALAQMRQAAAAPTLLDLSATARGDGEKVDVTVAASPRPGWTKNRNWRLRLALAVKSAGTHVLRGENQGEQLQEAAIVRVLSDPAPVPYTPAHLSLTKPADLSWADLELAVFVQDQSTLEVGAALSLPAAAASSASAAASRLEDRASSSSDRATSK
jgi:hypothetical protein